MEIIEIGKESIFKQKCNICGTTFRYNAQDAQKDFKCPICKQKLEPTWENSGKSIVDKTSFNLDYIHSLNPGDQITIPHDTYGNIAFEVCAKDYLIDGTITLVSKKCITNMEWNKYANLNRYSGSSVRYWLNHDFLSGFDDSIIDAIKTPDWECHDELSKIILNDKIIIPSMTEMGIKYSYSQSEGTGFAYKNIKDKFSGTVDDKSAADRCWTRTPCSSGTHYACNFDSSGSADGNYYFISFGVPVCFII